ncbi:unnamed protein product [Heligmosomoides polygyrus]|uniref:E3 ubiquitin-protein ligase TRAF7 n=1 Tax=Heligmosomoides polygyrus TaxID=6339 RepID=A0A183FUJ3_HELPZ|nr:unnamed protein product [Heligmosomoides polygyrus]
MSSGPPAGGGQPGVDSSGSDSPAGIRIQRRANMTEQPVRHRFFSTNLRTNS